MATGPMHKRTTRSQPGEPRGTPEVRGGVYIGLQSRGVFALPADLRKRHRLDQPGAQVRVVALDDAHLGAGLVEAVALAQVSGQREYAPALQADVDAPAHFRRAARLTGLGARRPLVHGTGCHARKYSASRLSCLAALLLHSHWRVRRGDDQWASLARTARHV